jgi:hypothetical protein
MGSSTVGSFAGANVTIVYDVNASCDDLHWPGVSNVQLCKTRLNHSITLALHNHMPDNRHIGDSDLFVLMYGGCYNDEDTLTGSLTDDADTAMPPVPLTDRAHPLL